jgi:hypothetical protein
MDNSTSKEMRVVLPGASAPVTLPRGWWITAVSWKNQTPGQMVPDVYLPRKK